MAGPEGLTAAQATRLLGTVGFNAVPLKRMGLPAQLPRKLWAPVPWMLEATIVREFVPGRRARNPGHDGDRESAATAFAVAADVGLTGDVVRADDLSALTHEERGPAAIAQGLPQDKRRIVELLQRTRQVVGMNDRRRSQ
ncbi:MAG: hypothetical protein HIU81_12220 [Acidobacteria bacterium]|nr:hypothetical protein [Acidobacteriota bacterium]